jgi:hypothetical protein
MIQLQPFKGSYVYDPTTTIQRKLRLLATGIPTPAVVRGLVEHDQPNQ